MEYEEYLGKVRAWLPLPLPDERDEWCIDHTAHKCFDEGWTWQEAAHYIRCFEEINPDLDEDTALKEMARIRKNVEYRLTMCKNP